MDHITIKGLDQILAKLQKLPDSVGKKAIKTGIKPACEVLLAEVERQAPFDTGSLVASLDIKPVKSRGGRVGMRVTTTEGKVSGVKFHSAFVEYGSKYQTANPFMRRAFEAKAEEAHDVAIEGIKEALDDAIGGK